MMITFSGCRDGLVEFHLAQDEGSYSFKTLIKTFTQDIIPRSGQIFDPRICLEIIIQHDRYLSQD